LALLDNAHIRQSREVFREYKPGSFTDRTQDVMPQTQDIPCVEVQIPERDWRHIEQIVLAHERAIRNPSVQAAWEQYVMLTHLTKTY
jgi:hypothetical protein